jgi:segregation and condensation protein B
MELEHIVEALIFASPDGVSAREMARVITTAAGPAKQQKAAADEGLQLEDGTSEEPAEPLDDHTLMMLKYAEVTEEEVNTAILNLVRTYQESGRAFTLTERPTGYRIAARPEYAPWVRQLFPEKKPSRLTPSALETLAIIAYRQPVTRASIEAVRGVSVDGPMQTLLDRNVVRIAGRADLPGRPLLYETTDLFLEHFGIKSVDELPNAAELRSVKLPEPEDEAPAKGKKGSAKSDQPELGLDGEAKPKRKGKKAAETAPEGALEEAQSPVSEEAVEPEAAEPEVTLEPEAELTPEIAMNADAPNEDVGAIEIESEESEN